MNSREDVEAVVRAIQVAAEIVWPTPDDEEEEENADEV